MIIWKKRFIRAFVAREFSPRMFARAFGIVLFCIISLAEAQNSSAAHSTSSTLSTGLSGGADTVSYTTDSEVSATTVQNDESTTTIEPETTAHRQDTSSMTTQSIVGYATANNSTAPSSSTAGPTSGNLTTPSGRAAEPQVRDAGYASIMWMLGTIAVLTVIVLGLLAGLIVVLKKNSFEWTPK